jgi:hypothetical protein
LSGLVAIVLIAGLVHVVVIRDDPGQEHQQSETRSQQQNPRAFPCAAVRHFRGHPDDQSRAQQRYRKFPWPEHQVKVILPAGVAPENNQNRDGDQVLDPKQDSE